MLGYWRKHCDYQKFVHDKLSELIAQNPALNLREYETAILKADILDLDPMKEIIKHTYSATGRPSELQPEIFRSIVIMNHLGFNLDRWIPKLRNNALLRTICGFADKLPAVASYYDFIDRIVDLDEKPRTKTFKRKPQKKLKKGEKLPNKRAGVVKKIVDKILDGRRLNNRPERTLQEVFAAVSVQKSIDLGLVPKTVSVSGDGTCIETGASHYGVKTCDCKSRGIYKCECNRRFSDPNATWGWDSHKERYFYGYTGYFISTYNKARKLDLPLYIRLVEASRHDSVSAVVGLAEFRDLYPNLKVDTFISDSASDNYATYELLHKWNINAVIALNSGKRGNFKYDEHPEIDENGTPVCPANYYMIHWGSCPGRHRIKWRCPNAVGYDCPNCTGCSKTDYGRTFYTKPKWDLRLFTAIPRGSDTFKNKMKERTAAERVNNRILHHYGIEKSHTRGKKRISFFSTVAAMNIHLDAQVDILNASLSAIITT